MRVAVLSDVHGYSLSLQAVLANIRQHGDFDRLIVAGDLAEEGPDPAGSIDIIRECGAEAIMGNTDWRLASTSESSGPRDWAREQLGPERLEWLRQLRFDIRVRPIAAGDERDDLLVVHANPHDWNRAIPPDATERELRELIGDTSASAIAFGHIHISYTRPMNDHLLIDVSAVGNPKDGDLRSRWGEIVWDGTRWSAEIHYVSVDTDAVIAQFRESGRPNVEKAIAKYLRASYAD